MKDGFILKKEEIEKVVKINSISLIFNIKINIILFTIFDLHYLHFFLLLTNFKKNIIYYS